MPRTPKFSTPVSVSSPVVSSSFPSSHASAPRPPFPSSRPAKLSTPASGGGQPSGKRRNKRQQLQQPPQHAVGSTAKSRKHRHRKHTSTSPDDNAQAGGEQGQQTGASNTNEPPGHGSNSDRRDERQKRHHRTRQLHEDPVPVPPRETSTVDHVTEPTPTGKGVSEWRPRSSVQRKRANSKQEDNVGAVDSRPRQEPSAKRGGKQQKKRQDKQKPRHAAVAPQPHSVGVERPSPARVNDADVQRSDDPADSSRSTTPTPHSSTLSSERAATATCPSVSEPSTTTTTPILRPAAANSNNNSGGGVHGHATGLLPRPESPPPMVADPAIVSIREAAPAPRDPHVAVARAGTARHTREKPKAKATTATTTRTATNTSLPALAGHARHERWKMPAADKGHDRPAPPALSPFPSASSPGSVRRESSSVIFLDSGPFSPIHEESSPAPTFAIPQPIAPSSRPVSFHSSNADSALSRRGLRADAPAFLPRSVRVAAQCNLLAPFPLAPSAGAPEAPARRTAAVTAPSPTWPTSLRPSPQQRTPVFPPAFVEGSSSVSSSRQLSCVASPVLNANNAGILRDLPEHCAAPTPNHTPSTAAARDATSRGKADGFPCSPGAAAAQRDVPVFPGTPRAVALAEPIPSASCSLSPKGLADFAPTSSARQLSMSEKSVAPHAPGATAGGAAAAASATRSASAKVGSPLGNTTSSTSATRNDHDNVRHTRLAVPDNLTEDRIYSLLEAGDDDEDLNGPGVQYYEAAAAAATASRARSAPSTVPVANSSVAFESGGRQRSGSHAHSVASARSVECGAVKATATSAAERIQGRQEDSEAGAEEEEEELFFPRGGGGARGSDGDGGGFVGAFGPGVALRSGSPDTILATTSLGVNPHSSHLISGSASLLVSGNDEWETRSTASAVSHHPRRVGNGGGYWGLEGPRASLGLFPPMSTYLASVAAADFGAVSPAALAASHEHQMGVGEGGVDSPAVPEGLDHASMENRAQQPQWHHESFAFYDAGDAMEQDYEDIWEMNSSAYEQDSLDEAQAQWIEEQLQAGDNPKGFFPF